MSDLAATTPNSPVPLCVDLDGTLVKTDLLWEIAGAAAGTESVLAFGVAFLVGAGSGLLEAANRLAHST